jgi:parvulin-like peptidyl-prolyl isomerase
MALAPSQHRTLLTLLLGATLALSGCGVQQSGAAAIVNDTVIRDQDVQSVSDQLNKLAQGGQQLRMSDVLISLILEPYVLAEAKRAGKTVSASQARKVIVKVPDPSPATVKFVQMQLAIQQLDQASKTSILNQIDKVKVTVNPRYGTFDAKQIALTPISPNWIKTSAPPVAK